MKLNAEQIEVIAIQQEVLSHVLLAMGFLNPAAMPSVAAALRVAAADSQCGPTPSKLLADLARRIDEFGTRSETPVPH